MQRRKPFFTRAIKAICFDVDGVFTDGNILVTETGVLLRHMNIKDGYALKQVLKNGFPVAAITGGRSMGVIKRLQGLGMKDIFSGIEDKMPIFERWCAQHKLEKASVLYVGDDLPDQEIMKAVGYAACPRDAVEEVKSISGYISSREGGKGCVRDICQQFLAAHNLWDI